MDQARAIIDLLKTTFHEWNEDKVPRLAAALAYYTAFSIAPLLIIVIAVAGLAFGQEAARGQIVDQIQGQIGADTAEIIQTMIENTSRQEAGIIATVIGVVTIVLGAAGFFGQLQDALNTVWEVTPKPGGSIVSMIKARFLSFTMVLGIGFLLLVSLIISAVLANLSTFVGGILPGAELLARVINFVLTFGVVMLLFAMIYKVLPDAIIAWRDVWVGAAITALLFNVGKFLLGLYLGNSSIATTYGAAGSLVVLLVWVYYTAQILLFGAEFTQVYARRYGSHIVPAENAVAVTEAQRAQEGLVRSPQVTRNQLEDPQAAPVVVLVNEPAQLVDGHGFEAWGLRDDTLPERKRRWSVFLLGIVLYNAVVGGLVLARSVLRSR